MDNRWIRGASSTLLLVAGLSAAGCGSGSDAPANQLDPGRTLQLESAGGRAKGDVRAEGGHIAQGRNALLIEFDPVATELLSASAFMPVHGHMTPSPPAIAHEGTGYRVSDLILSMPGLWDVTLDIQVDSKADKLELTVDVP